MLLHLFSVGILPLAVCIFGVEVILSSLWHKRCLHSLLHERLPVKTYEPIVLFKHVGTLLAKTVTWLALN